MKRFRIGVMGASTKSGRAFLAKNILRDDVVVHGYARESAHGKEFAEGVQGQGGIWVEWAPWFQKEPQFAQVSDPHYLGHDIQALMDADVIFLSHPTLYHEESVRKLCSAGLLKRNIPLVLPPSRTLGSPYLWRVLVEEGYPESEMQRRGYPIISLGTCPYAAKAKGPNVFIKGEKDVVIGSLDAPMDAWVLEQFCRVYPQVHMNTVPGTTSLGNIGAVLHMAYVLNWDELDKIQNFYKDGIAAQPWVAAKLEDVDKTQLEIALAVGGMEVFGHPDNPRNQEWLDIVRDVRERHGNLNGANYVMSAQQWLAMTYGIYEAVGKSLQEAIAVTHVYGGESIPTPRYLEDSYTGLVPLEALARRLGDNHATVTEIIDMHGKKIGRDPRLDGRNLEGYDTEYLINYLQGSLYDDHHGN
jgi:opine dehydrogenase